MSEQISDAWKQLNKECLNTNPLPSSFTKLCLNAARMVPIMYNYDGNTPSKLEEYVKSLLYDGGYLQSIHSPTSEHSTVWAFKFCEVASLTFIHILLERITKLQWNLCITYLTIECMFEITVSFLILPNPSHIKCECTVICAWDLGVRSKMDIVLVWLFGSWELGGKAYRHFGGGGKRKIFFIYLRLMFEREARR